MGLRSECVAFFVFIFLAAVHSDACVGSTGHDAEGPFYSANAPIRHDLSGMDPKSPRLSVSGQVINYNSCQGLLAKIDFWSANSSGVYDNVGYNMRGSFYTDSDGYYSVNTRMPGEFYPRPHHIHVKIWVDDIAVLTTQLYFKNYGVGGGASARELQVVDNADSDGYLASFDFIIDHPDLPDTIQDTEPPEIGFNHTAWTSTTSSSAASTSMYTTEISPTICCPTGDEDDSPSFGNRNKLHAVCSLILAWLSSVIVFF